MIRALLALVFLAALFSPAAHAAANQVSCGPSFPMTIAYGDDVNTNCQLTEVGQIALLNFQGNTGDHITIVLTSSWSNGPCFGLYDPTNKEVGGDSCGDNYPFNDYVVGTNFTLAMTGQYTIRIHDVGYSSTGTFGLMLDCYNPVVVASPLTLGITANGTTVHNETIDDWTFTGTVGEDLTLQVSSSYSNGPCFSLVGPNGMGVGSVCGNNYPFNDYQARGEYTLAAAGTYVVTVYSDGFSESGTYQLLGQCLASCTAQSSGPTQSQTITFGPPGNQALGTASFVLNATASSGLTVTFVSNTTSICTVSGATVTLVAAGTCSITANQSGDSAYSAANPVTQTFTISAGSGTGTPSAPVCSYVLSPASQVIPAAGGMGYVGILTEAGCPWTASISSGSSFLSIISGTGSSGPNSIEFRATANTTAATQTATLTIAGLTATVTQPGTAPLLLLSPTSLAVQYRQQGPLPTAIPLSVFTAASSLDYTAAASSTGNWLTVSPASGSAPATIIVGVNPSSLQPGPYQGTVTVTAPTANPSSQTFTVSLTVVAAGSPALSVSTTSLNYSFAQGAQQVQQQRIPIGNSGGGTLSYTASASTNSGGNWLSVTQDAAGATLLTPDPLTVSVDPSSLGVGTYTGQITITTPSTAQSIPVTLTVSAVQQTILLSQTGLTFTAVAGGGIVPPQTFGILNSGNGVMDWSVSGATVTGGNWLSITPNSGSTDASSLTVPLVTVSVNPVGLAPGAYSGQIQVTSTTADNSPQFVSVILNVLPGGSNPGPLVLPTGLIFTQAAGGAAAGTQTITLSNLTQLPLTFTTGTLTTDGGGWFAVTPTTGTATPTQATTLTVSVNSGGLSPGIRQGVLTLLFQDGSVRTVNVLFLLVAGGVSSDSRGAVHPFATGGSCTPTKLLPLVTSLGSQFTVPAAWPNTIETQVVDDCGNPLVSGTVVATFSNGDPPLPLISLKNGNWTGTWQVNNANVPLVAITVNADEPSLKISGTTSVSGSLQSTANAPVMSTGGVLNAASFAVSTPLAPGTMIAIFGSNLADGTSTSSTLPLSTQLSGTLVTIGGEPAPLLFASSGQVNAIIPYGLPVNTHLQVIVRQGNAYTSPQSITLSAANPAIFTQALSGTGQGIIIRPDGQYAESGTPAQAGDEIVIYAGGLGDTTPEATAGQAAPSSPLENVPGVSVTIGGQSARVDFAGLVPSLTGLYQINAAVPAGVSGNAVPVVITVAGQPSPPVTMAVQ
jgi:uncharacterized protein (TIGR03437 family)